MYQIVLYNLKYGNGKTMDRLESIVLEKCPSEEEVELGKNLYGAEHAQVVYPDARTKYPEKPWVRCIEPISPSQVGRLYCAVLETNYEYAILMDGDTRWLPRNCFQPEA